MADEVIMVVEGEDGRNWLTGPPLDTIPRMGEVIIIDGEQRLRVTEVEHSIRVAKPSKLIITVKVRPV